MSRKDAHTLSHAGLIKVLVLSVFAVTFHSLFSSPGDGRFHVIPTLVILFLPETLTVSRYICETASITEPTRIQRSDTQKLKQLPKSTLLKAHMDEAWSESQIYQSLTNFNKLCLVDFGNYVSCSDKSKQVYTASLL